MSKTKRPIHFASATLLALLLSAPAIAGHIEGESCTLAITGDAALDRFEKEDQLFSGKNYRIVGIDQNPEFVLFAQGPGWQEQASPNLPPNARFKDRFVNGFWKAAEFIWDSTVRSSGFAFFLERTQISEVSPDEHPADGAIVYYSTFVTQTRYDRKLRRRLNWYIPQCVVRR